MSDSDAEDAGAEPAAQQQQLASPEARAALAAYSIGLRPCPNEPPLATGGHPPACSRSQPAENAAPCSSSASITQAGRNAELGVGQGTKGAGKMKRHRGKRREEGTAVAQDEGSEEQPLQSRPALSLARDPAKDIARAAARGLGSSANLSRGLSLVPLMRPNLSSARSPVGSSNFNVSSFSVEGALQHGTSAMLLQTPRQLNVLEPVEFAIDRPPWRRSSSSQSRRLQSFVSFEPDSKDQAQHAALEVQPAGLSMPSVVTPILTTAQLDPDCMEGDRAIPDYPWHYNFIPAARRAPVGTAGFAANATAVEQDRRRLLLIDAQQCRNGLAVATLNQEPAEEQFVPTASDAVHSPVNQSRLMGYSRSLSGTTYKRQLPNLEINGHPVSLRPERPSSARITIG